ncbi:phage protein [Streptococcus pneumoniae]|uniref:Phage protein n=2 Tax=Streptococcus pneumoniae TaxID=1313 RepID=A0AAQ3A055_STREE|nr:phage protein [Streptococcus pneumoniae]VIP31652.1 phage protein [Streptococcus pneumoniae]VJB32461.1 phage protein [Streptococcus pneumoniae]VJB67221.1 phage protein [Streptococcus pneumoniae]VJC34086.1 phage protein [Streptococcus pneumoniae]
MRKKHQVVKFKDIAEKLPELEGKRLEEITKVLGYRNLESCRTNLCKLKQNNRLDFTLEKGVYSKFALLDGTVKEELEDKELSERGRWKVRRGGTIMEQPHVNVDISDMEKLAEVTQEETEKILTYDEIVLLKPITHLHKSIFRQTEYLSEQLTERLHHLEDYNSPIDEETIRLAEVTIEFYNLLIKSPSISTVVKEIVSEGHKS